MLTRPAPQDAAGHDCATTRRQVFAACDGELTPAELRDIDGHLSSCAGCRAHFTADATLHHVVRAAARLDAAPPGLRERVERLLHAHTTENAPA
ncbi:MAG: zf-HC2 domain-containing protein [Gemmatimonadaceae bacterium]|nr:zf-HC2 domain-containing protein [Gemmatimonadaceae bacterium]